MRVVSKLGDIKFGYLCWNYVFDQGPFEVQLLYSNTLKVSTFLAHFSVQKLTSVSLLWHFVNIWYSWSHKSLLIALNFHKKTKRKFWMMKIDIKTTTSCDMFFVFSEKETIIHFFIISPWNAIWIHKEVWRH